MHRGCPLTDSQVQCDQVKPQCSRCRKQNLPCQPSVQARWRVRTLHNSTSRGEPSASPSPSVFCEATAPLNLSTSAPERHLQHAREGDLSSPSAATSSQDHGFGPTQGDGDEVPDTLGQTRDSPEAHMSSENGGVPTQDFTECRDQSLNPSRPMSVHPFDPCLSGNEQPSPSMLDVLDSPYNFISFDTFTEFFDWDSQSPSLQRPPANEPWIQDSSTLASGGDHIAIPDTLDSLIQNFLDSTEQNQDSLMELRPYLYFLWTTFVGRISPFLTPFGRRVDNPLLKYLVPNAAKSTSLFVAILYFTQIIVGRRRREPLGPEGRFVDDKAEDILRKLEENVSCEIPTASTPNLTEKAAHSLVLTLSTTLVFCMGFLASQNAVKLASHVEYAVLLCQVLFKTHADDEEFLYLAKLLGFIQITLLFTRRANSISAPDYLSAALEAQDDSPRVSLRKETEDLRHACTRFHDLDMFSGLSASMASILYTLGRLARAKHGGYSGSPESHAEFARAFESDIDGLETRLQRRLAVLLRHRRDSQRRMTASPIGEKPRVSAMARHLDAFNEAVFWSCWSIFYTDLKGRTVATDPDLAAAVDSILDACAEIPKDSAAASLIFFPLMVGGIKSTKKVYREFVLARLECLDNIGVSDTRSLRAELIEKWWTSEAAAESPLSFFGFVF